MNTDSTHGHADSSSQADARLGLALDWYAGQGWSAFPFQQETWQAYLDGASGIVTAPTGTGKTNAVWLGPLLEYVIEQQSVEKRAVRPTEPLRVLWLTPLRALAADTASALEKPVLALDLPWTVELRTGDTKGSIKARQRKRLPTALVTTPESLSLLLSYPETRQMMGHLRAVVVDEWHELLGSKRGVQTELALARLREWNPGLKVWGLSATLGNLEQARDVLLGPKRGPAGRIIQSDQSKQTEIATLIPADVRRFPWAGHLGLTAVPGVVEAIRGASTTLVFTNTRNQAENWYQALTLYEPEWEDSIGLHHGSLAREERDRVEQALAAGKLKAVVCTSSLDLGVDFAPVEQVIQVGSPKGVGRLLQRAGRSGHQPGAPSRALCVPTNAFEMVEFAAARESAQAGRIEPRRPLTLSLDVLIQHIVTVALGGGFVPDELLVEVRCSYSFAELSDAAWQWSLDFVTSGGAALSAYPQYCKVMIGEDGRCTVESREVARWHRLGIGTITSDSMVRVKYLTGSSTIGHVEEAFIGRLRPGDRFLFAGRLLELAIVKDMTAYVRRASGIKGTVPRWAGGRLPLTSELGSAVRDQLADYRAEHSPEMAAMRPILDLQERWSKIPKPGELLVETTKSREGHHVFLYPFQGRFVHEGLAALLAYRLSRQKPLSISVSANDYGLELLCKDALGLDEGRLHALCSTENLVDDLAECANAAELARRQFRDIARIAGLVFMGYPGAQKQARQLQASSGLLWDVFTKYDPGNLLVDEAQREVLQGQLEVTRLRQTMATIGSEPIALCDTARITPLAFPIWAERIQAQVSSEGWTERVQKMALQLEQAADRPRAARPRATLLLKETAR